MNFSKNNFVTLILLVIVLNGFSYCLDLNLKISGSLNYLNLNQVNLILQGREDLIKKNADFYQDWAYKEGEVNNFHLGTCFEGEFLLFFSPRIATGLGIGYLYGDITEEKTSVSITRKSNTFIYMHPITINAFPFNLSVYYFLPLQSKLKLFVKGGAGLLWTKYVERKEIKKMPDDKFTYLLLQKATSLGKSFISGIGLIYEAEENIHFFIEGKARLARISGFRGETKQGEEGTLYFFEEYNQELDFWQSKNALLIEEPSGDNYRSVQKSIIDLSGISIVLGFSFKF